MPKRPDLGEIASTREGRDITRGYVDGLRVLPTTDDVFQSVGGWRAWKELLRDDQVAATFSQRRLAVVSRPTEVEPASQSRRDKRAAEVVRETLDRIEWDAITDQMLYARLFGYAVAEVLWQIGPDGVQVRDIVVRDPERFAFAPDGSLLLRTLRRPDGEPVPERKFWVVAVGAHHHDEPYGRGLAHQLYWPVWFKRQGARYWAIFLEKFGAPTAVGTFPAGTDAAERARLLDALAAIQTDSGIAIPEGMQISLLEASRAGNASYEEWMAYWDRAIAKIVLGQTMTTEDGSSRAQAQVHYDVRREIVQADADLICRSAVASWVTWLVDLAVPGAQPPLIWRDLSDPEDLNVRAQRDKVLAELGWQLKPDAVTRVYGDDYEQRQQQEPEPAPQPEGEQSPVEAAERQLPAPPADQIADRLEVEAQPEVDGWIDALEAMVREARSLDELRALIVAAWPDLPAERLTTVLSQALVSAVAAGRADVIDEAGGA